MSTARDTFLARLAAARTGLAAAVDAVDEVIAHTINPDDDLGGDERSDLIDLAEEAVGAATRALQAAAEVWEEKVDAEEGEEDEEDDDEEDDDEPGEEPEPKTEKKRRRRS